MNALVSVPFLRILIPFIGGILVAICYPLVYPGHLFTTLFLLLSLLAGFTPHFKNKLLFLLTADVFLFLFGSGLTGEKTNERQKNYFGHFIHRDSLSTVVAMIDDLPTVKPGFIKCSVKILQLKTKAGALPVKGDCLLYFRRSENDSLLNPGTVLQLNIRFSSIPGPLNPFEFDYRAYLHKKQIDYSAFVQPGSWCVRQSSLELNAVWMAGLSCKKFVLEKLKQVGLSITAYGICCALLTGYDDEIDRPVMEAFSHSGTLHVLSVSGLHTGLLYLALSFLFDLIDPKRRWGKLRFGCVTIFLWGFALVAGFPSPVLRAVIMFNLLGIGKLFFRNRPGNQLNILLASAFALLCYNPFYLADIGFLLSYFAMAGLICFQPGLSRLWQPDNFILKALWQSVSASTAATISTLPITLFFFKQFPLWFFVSNVVVIPATFLLLLLALLALVNLPFCVPVVNFVVAFLERFISLFDSPSYGFIDRIDFNATDVLFLSLLILLMYEVIVRRSVQKLRWSLYVLICWQLVSLTQSVAAKQSSQLSVYALKRKSCVSIKNKTTVQLSQIPEVDLNRHIKPHLVSFNNVFCKQSVDSFNCVRTRDETVLLLNQRGFLPKINADSVTVLVVSNNFILNETELRRYRRLKTVVMDGSNSRRQVEKMRSVCDSCGVTFYPVSRMGAFVLPFPR